MAKRKATQGGQIRMPQSNEELVEMVHNLKYFEDKFEQVERATRPGYFRAKLDEERGIAVLNDGSETVAYYFNPDDKELGQKVKPGDMVIIGGPGTAIIEVHPTTNPHGTLMVLERLLPDGRMEMNEDGRRQVCWPSQKLADDIKAGTVKPGAKVIVKPGPAMAIEALPEPDGLNRYQFLVKGPHPRVFERDLGNPHPWLGKLRKFLHRWMVDPKIQQRYGLRSFITVLFQGVAGGGKTTILLAGQTIMYETIAEVTGVPIESIPHRTLRMKASGIFDQWLGNSDKNMDRFFDELEELGSKPVKLGRKEYLLPVFCVIEEFEAIARQRGEDAGCGGVYDRVTAGFLQRLDATRPELRNLIGVVAATSNEPKVIDHAAMRRIGGTIENVGMLTKESFPLVLAKHLAKVPVESDNGTPQASLKESMVDYLTASIFTDERPLVELMTAKGAVKKHRKDFLTPALIDRAVQQAAEIASDMEAARKTDGVPMKVLAECLESQINSVANQLSERNVHKYLDLGDDERVSKVRRVV